MQTKMFEKVFSKIGNLQKEFRISYSKTMQTHPYKSFGILMEKIEGDSVERAEINDISINEQRVENLLAYLYENAVSPVHAYDIIYDLL